MKNNEKYFQSDHYRKDIKNLTEMVKRYRGLKRIPNSIKRPAKNRQKQDIYDKIYPVSVDKQTLKYWLTNSEFEDFRRTIRSSEKID